VHKVVSANVVKRASSDKHQMNGNGIAHLGKAKVSKTDFEIPRKLLHSSIGTFACPFSSHNVMTHLNCAGFVQVSLPLWLALCDLLRFRSPRFERAYERVLGFLMRETEKVCPIARHQRIHVLDFFIQNSTNGVVWYIRYRFILGTLLQWPSSCEINSFAVSQSVHSRFY
jgi:diacylglycerol kinase (CTP)